MGARQPNLNLAVLSSALGVLIKIAGDKMSRIAMAAMALAVLVMPQAQAGDLLHMKACLASGNSQSVCNCANDHLRSAMQAALPPQHFKLLDNRDFAKMSKELSARDHAVLRGAMGEASQAATSMCGMATE